MGARLRAGSWRGRFAASTRFLVLAVAGAGLAPAAGGQPVPPGISDVVEGVYALVEVSYDVDGDGRFDAGERLKINNEDLAEQNVEAVRGPVEASVQRTHTVAISPSAQSITVTLSADCRSERPAAGDPLEDFGYARADGGAVVTFRLGSPGNFSISGSAAGSPTQLAIQSNRTESYVELRSSGEVVAQAFGNFFDPGDVPSSIDESGSLAPGLYTLVAACESGAPRGLDGGGFDAPLAESSAQVTLTVTTGECEPEAVSWAGDRVGAFDDAENWEPPRVPLADEAAGRCDEILVRGGRGIVIDLDGDAAPALALADATAPTPIKRTPRFTVDASRELQPKDGTIEGTDTSFIAGERSVEVINGASLLLNGGGVFARHLGVGSRGEGAIEVVSPRGYLETTGRLGLGIEGSGSLLVRDGGTVSAAEMVVGEERAQGTATVQGSLSTLHTGSIAIGFKDDGALLVEGGATVTSETSVIDFNLIDDSRGRVTVRGKDAAGNSSTWTADSLDVRPRGSLVVEDGGKVEIDGALKVGFEGASADCLNDRACVKVGARSGLFVGSLAVGFEGGAEMRVGIGEFGGISVDGVTQIGLVQQPGTLVMQSEGYVNSLSIAPNERSVGTLDLLAGSRLFVFGPLRVGEGLYSTGEITLSRDDASAAVPELEVRGGTSFFGFPELPNGERPQSALLSLAPGTFSSDRDVVIEATGLLESAGGRVELLEQARLVNRGKIRGGLTVAGDYAQETGGIVEGNVLETPAPPASQALRSASPLLLAPLAAAPPPPAFEPIVVTGNATLAGKAKLQFGNGAAPKQGDAFSLLEVEGEVTGAFDEVEVAGLAPGAGFASEVVNGALVLTSLTDAEPLPYVNLKGKPLLLETKKAAKVKLTRTGDTTLPLTVAYTVGGTATSGVDYAALPGAIEFPAKKKSVTLLVQPIADALEEGSETIELSLAPNASFAPGLTATLTIELRDGKTK